MKKNKKELIAKLDVMMLKRMYSEISIINLKKQGLTIDEFALQILTEKAVRETKDERSDDPTVVHKDFYDMVNHSKPLHLKSELGETIIFTFLPTICTIEYWYCNKLITSKKIPR